MTVFVGMSGFSYPEWVGDFYPEGTKREQMLAYYATRLGAVEINMTFRRNPVEKTLKNWRAAVGDDFRFSLKANQRITHFKKLVDTSDDVALFYERSKTLGEALGPIVFQIPPKLAFDEALLDTFFAGLPPGGSYALEPRSETFTGSTADAVFSRHGVARCLNDGFFDPASYTVTGPFAYFRFHRADYTPEHVAERAEVVKRLDAQGIDVYVFFKHEDSAESVEPALRLRELV